MPGPLIERSSTEQPGRCAEDALPVHCQEIWPPELTAHVATLLRGVGMMLRRMRRANAGVERGQMSCQFPGPHVLSLHTYQGIRREPDRFARIDARTLPTRGPYQGSAGPTTCLEEPGAIAAQLLRRSCLESLTVFCHLRPHPTDAADQSRTVCGAERSRVCDRVPDILDRSHPG